MATVAQATPKVGGGPVTYKLHVEFAELSLQAPASQEVELTKTTRAPVKPSAVHSRRPDAGTEEDR